MKIPKEAICTVCKQIFCCEKCRKKHEIKKHAIRVKRNHVEATTLEKEQQLTDISYMLCPICTNRPFPLREIIYKEMLEHIKCHHLPLHCQKCLKVYMKVDELRQFSKCMETVTSTPETTSFNRQQQVSLEACCILNTTTKSTIQQNTISTQTSPYTLGRGELKGFPTSSSTSMTPLSIVNLQWQSKTKAIQDISECVSSFKNFSIISNSTSLQHSNGCAVTQVEVKGKLVRTTSTPVSHTETDSSKPKEQTFNVSAAQVSSIYNSNCETEYEHSPIGSNVDKGGACTTTNPQVEAVNLYRKFNGRTKIAAVTPLRQVMSKSIQKAFAEHGLPSFSERKTTRDAVSIYDGNPNSPLDLRLSPALRRGQGDSSRARSIKHTEKVLPQRQTLSRIPGNKQSFQNQLTTESIVISCTKHLEQFSNETTNSVNSISANSVYETCQSFEIISTELGESICIDQHNDIKENHNEMRCALKFKSSSHKSNLSSITPINRLSGNSINKKIIQFETPNVEKNNSDCCKTPIAEKFYTPICNTPIASEEDSLAVNLSLSKMAVVRNLNTRFSPSRRPSIRDCAQSTAYSYYNVDIDEHDASNDEVFLEKTKSNQTKGNGFLKTIVNSVLRLPTLKDTPKVIYQNDTKEYGKSTIRSSIIKRCASIAGTLVRSTSLMDEKQLQTLKRKRTYTIDSQLSPYKSVCQLRSVSYLHNTNDAHELSSTKRFRIQPRKPIERMRNTNN